MQLQPLTRTLGGGSDTSSIRPPDSHILVSALVIDSSVPALDAETVPGHLTGLVCDLSLRRAHVRDFARSREHTPGLTRVEAAPRLARRAGHLRRHNRRSLSPDDCRTRPEPPDEYGQQSVVLDR